MNLISKIYRRFLKLIFGFDKWHISPLKERPYAIDIIRYCNKLSTRSFFAEIGCGLGDITRNVLFENRTGYDMDEKVLKAARFLPVIGSRKSITYKVFHFPETLLSGSLNVLTMVNWIHHVEPETLKTKLSEYFNKNLLTKGEIIIDTVQDPTYKYNHDIKFLSKDLNCSIHCLGKYARKREVWAIKKLN